MIHDLHCVDKETQTVGAGFLNATVIYTSYNFTIKVRVMYSYVIATKRVNIHIKQFLLLLMISSLYI